jgi:hypothetical protein
MFMTGDFVTPGHENCAMLYRLPSCFSGDDGTRGAIKLRQLGMQFLLSFGGAVVLTSMKVGLCLI